ncbi:prepilin-type N-terminal cleavage/methylation domain-containing protein [Desulfobacula sp.]|uniref:prepilin-type N-terminal cleavage/methylation domain-containing protein n=1 Tax=Desulfobacula sp. TaxID=2593537 RepID=UPI0026053426|nr:prepilin-type N-terminal cleavage/methylation domain-containing protein [Desulfobacula sp.]
MSHKYNVNNRGFTLVELLIAMTITTIVSAGIFSAYQNQQKAQLAQKQVIEMQQNLRVALYIMTSDIRMAGYDPDGTSGTGIVSAGDGSNGYPLAFNFLADDDNRDNDNDSTVDEPGEIQYVAYDLYDGYGDGDTDIGKKVSDATGAIHQPLAENIKTLQFAYLDEDGAIVSLPPSLHQVAALDLPKIKSVQITIEATIDINETDYVKGKNRILTTTVKCRNLGL